MYLSIDKFYPLLLGFVATLVFILVLNPLARRWQWVDKPDNNRKLHGKEIPLTGGVAMMLAFTLVVSWLDFDNHTYLLVVMALMCVIGVIDDLYHLSPRLRMVMQIALAFVLVVFSGDSLVHLGDWFATGDIVLSTPMAIVVTVFTIIGAMNAINMIDGIDGLAGSIVLNALFWIVFMTSIVGIDLTPVVLVLMGCLFAYLLFNKPLPLGKRAGIFMGDAGSMMLGVGLSWLLIGLSQPTLQRELVFSVPVAVWLIAVPLLDTVSVTLCRGLKGGNPFKADCNHIHHILLRHGFNRTQVLIILYLLSFALGAMGVAGWWFELPDVVMFYGFCLVFAVYFYVVHRGFLREVEWTRV